VEHTGIVWLWALPVPEPRPGTSKLYLDGDVKCTHKFTKKGAKYTIDGFERMKQEVEMSTTSVTGYRLVGNPIFSGLRVLSLTKDGAPQSVMNVKSPIDKSDRYRILHITPIYNPDWWREWVKWVNKKF